MEIVWKISKDDVDKLKQFVISQDNQFVQKRRERNINKKGINISKDNVIKAMLMCLLTSQQKSGPDSTVNQFLNKHPFPVTFSSLAQIEDIEKFLKSTLKKNKLTRFNNQISEYFAKNFIKMQTEKWAILNELQALNKMGSKTEERKIANRLADSLIGFGPKQARNFLQAIGLTKYEIPIDSRITRWLNEFGFPLMLSSKSLSDKSYYNFVLDGIQKLCDNANIFPCILDAAIFSSTDKSGWTEENIIF